MLPCIVLELFAMSWSVLALMIPAMVADAVSMIVLLMLSILVTALRGSTIVKKTSGHNPHSRAPDLEEPRPSAVWIFGDRSGLEGR